MNTLRAQERFRSIERRYAPALVVLVFAKVLAVAALLAGFVFYFTPLHPWNYLVFSDKTAGPFLAFINWDGQHYLRLAVGGYPVPPDPSAAFFPLFPALLAGVMRSGLGPIAAGLTVVTATSLAVVLLLRRLLPEDDPRASSIWLFASFPTAFYLSTVYAEGLFLALFLVLVLSLRSERGAGARYALVAAALLPLARGEGMWLAIPLAVTWLTCAVTRAQPLNRRSLEGATLGYILGVAGYFAFFAWRYGDPLTGLRAQEAYVFKNAVSNLFDLGRFVDFLLTPPRRFLDTLNSGLDKSIMALSLACLALGARRGADPFVLSAWISFVLFPALMGEGGSYARHALLAWTCFVLIAGPTLGPAIKWPLVGLGFLAQTYLAFCFGGNRWVS